MNDGQAGTDQATFWWYFKKWSYFLGAGSVLGCVVAALIAASVGQVALALLISAVALFCAMAFGQKVFVKRLGPRSWVEHGGTTFRPGRVVDVLGATMMVIGLAGGVAWAVLGVLGEVSFPFGSHYAMGYVIFFGGFASVCVAYLATMVRNHGTAYMRITPTDFALVEGFFAGRGAWADVVTVNDDIPVYTVGFWRFKTTKAQPYAWCAITLTKGDGTMATVPNGNLYAPNGDALREWIRFYWQHPEHREELADDRGLDRLRAWEPTAA